MSQDLATRINRWMVLITTLIMASELAFLFYDRQWFNVSLVSAIMLLMISPTIFRSKLPVVIPAEFLVLAQMFIFSALFLGEVRGYYLRLWWWDIALHTSSGLMLGLMGFLLVYILNENRHAELSMRPRFVALFAFVFAVAVGSIWEIFEFFVDSFLGTEMQNAMLGDPSGLTDTMWDLTVDTVGAMVISVLGWWYMHRKEKFFIEVWIHKFIERNPRMFSN